MREAAKLTGVNRNTVNAWAKSGRIGTYGTTAVTASMVGILVDPKEIEREAQKITRGPKSARMLAQVERERATNKKKNKSKK
jgi:predicted site-specific integrase-resolvase